jgi:hypothetical protein
MRVLSTLCCWLRAIAFSSKTRQEVPEEFNSCLDAYTSDLMRQGLSAQEAARRARAELDRCSILS